MRSLSLSLLALLALLQCCQARSRHRQMTVEVAAGTEECFYVEKVKVAEINAIVTVKQADCAADLKKAEPALFRTLG